MAKKKKVSKKAASKKKTSKKKTGKKKVTKKNATKKNATKKNATKKSSPKKTNKKTSKKKASKKKRSSSVKVGEKVNDFSLETTGGAFHLADQKGKVVVLYFYPKDATPGCTLEGRDFTRLHEDFKNANAEIYGVSRDSVKSHENFKAKENYSMDLISDPKEEACNLFDVIKEKNMYGRKVLGIERSTFVIDPEGRLVKEWRGVKVPGHAQEVLEFVRTL